MRRPFLATLLGVGVLCADALLAPAVAQSADVLGWAHPQRQGAGEWCHLYLQVDVYEQLGAKDQVLAVTTPVAEQAIIEPAAQLQLSEDRTVFGNERETAIHMAVAVLLKGIRRELRRRESVPVTVRLASGREVSGEIPVETLEEKFARDSHPFRFEGGDGSSRDRKVVIKVADSHTLYFGEFFVAVHWLELRGLRPTDVVVDDTKGAFDSLVVTASDGHEYFFDAGYLSPTNRAVKKHRSCRPAIGTGVIECRIFQVGG